MKVYSLLLKLFKVLLGNYFINLTDFPGSSDYFIGGVVSYSNDVKIKLVGVDLKSIEQFGAVSSEVALEMAEGVREKMGSDIGLSVTGIAGPDGGSTCLSARRQIQYKLCATSTSPISSGPGSPVGGSGPAVPCPARRSSAGSTAPAG